MGIGLEAFYWENNKTINVVNIYIYIFPMKVVSKPSYCNLLTIAQSVFVNIIHK